MNDIEKDHTEFLDDLVHEANARKELKPTIFFEKFSTIAADNGDTGDLEYCPARKEGSHGYQIDGYMLDAIFQIHNFGGRFYHYLANLIASRLHQARQYEKKK